MHLRVWAQLDPSELAAGRENPVLPLVLENQDGRQDLRRTGVAERLRPPQVRGGAVPTVTAGFGDGGAASNRYKG